MTEKQYQFLLDEFNITKEKFNAMTHDELGELYDKLALIEEIEAVKCEYKEMSTRGLLAADTLDFLYNNYCK